ncbi:MAG: hypothetical protein AABZ80_12560 [Gemmatimonadota bacterium]
MTRPVSAAGRLLDVAAVGLIVGGGVTYAMAYQGFERIRAAPEVAYTRGMRIAALAEFYRLTTLSRVGLGMVVLGVVLGVVAAIVAHRNRRVEN